MTDTINGFLAADHDRLDGLFAEFQKGTREDPARARESFAEFRRGLLRHIGWEETLLFPVFEERMGASAGPTAVMRSEHAHIKDYLQRLESGLGTDTSALESGLLSVLGPHNMKEEHILYPWFDEAFSEEDRLKTVARMRADAA
jgi:iron-sulfur cluster repair protein YtfE (RIC family)